ncbi:hypothetical protein [Rhodococcus qingshengii]|uniref:hypothetical protein n=1 Tax=Rhodococcus qingshengii TaxID=334542 RepID=UPI001C23CF61|nr:hypothetical protein [Rhodococcus qingshengii]QXC46895.1 hypothetical protein KSE96_33105 [Rhodococcus qingshengii]
MAASDRVVSTRFTESEFTALQSLSVLTGETVNGLIRRAVHEYAQNAVQSNQHAQWVQDAQERAMNAERELRRSIGADTGTMPRISAE